MASHIAVWSLALLSTFANASPFPVDDLKVSVRGGLSKSAQFDYPLDKREKKAFPLRVLPLGASITFGIGSKDGNGYRKDVRDQLRFAGWEVDMVGGVQSGSMKDSDNQGHPGYRVDAIAQVAEDAVKYQPNLITINAGTNDAVQNKTEFPIETVHERMDKMLDMIYSKIPGVTVLLSTVLENGNGKTNKNVKIINPQYRAIVERRRKANQRIVLAEMYESDTPWLNTKDLNTDGTHPTDAGYKKMAAIWVAAFQEADKAHMLQPANKGTRGTTCAKDISGDASQVHTPKNFFDAVQPCQTAQVVGSDTKEGLYTVDNKGIYVYKLVNGQYTEGAQLDIKSNCWAKDVRWFDVNNDGVDDFICLGSDQGKSTTVQINNNGKVYPPTFKDVGKCSIPRQGDDGAVTDPKLPTPPHGKKN